MAADGRRTAGPVTFAGGVLDRYRHVCAFVNEQREVNAVLDPFIRQGIDGGDRLLYLVDPEASAAPVNRLRHLGYNVGALLEHRQAEVRTWSETYLRGG
ncbi:MAG TPA: MEDS domain-containing protein, partial [Agromyces sp.]